MSEQTSTTEKTASVTPIKRARKPRQPSQPAATAGQFWPEIKVAKKIVATCSHNGHASKKDGRTCGQELASKAGVSINHVFYKTA
jgi:hypothetical protein